VSIEAIITQPLEVEVVSIFDQIDSQIKRLLSVESELDHGYAKLGLLLTEVSENEMWRDTQFKSFDDYLSSLSDRFHRGRTMLYHYFSAVREMRPYLSEEQMNKMGISKLSILKKATKELGFPPNNNVIETALDPEKTVSDVRKSVAQNHKLTEQEQTGTWFDLGGFFATAEERLVIRQALEAAWHTDPVVQKTVKESIRLKEGLLRLAMEYLSTHGEAVEEGVA
jgi:TusA-related sulfurtransferase